MTTRGAMTLESLVRSHHVLVSRNDRHLNKHVQNLAFPMKFIPDFFFNFVIILLSSCMPAVHSFILAESGKEVYAPQTGEKPQKPSLSALAALLSVRNCERHLPVSE